MMGIAKEVRLTITEGPVIIRGLGDSAIDETHALWDGMTASETFPAGAGERGANYVVTLMKGVKSANDVPDAEANLTRALHMLAAAWSFAGGSCMVIETREVISSSRVESNAAYIEREMLEASGLHEVASAVSIPISWSATYSQPPLRSAIHISKAMNGDYQMRKVLEYYYRAVAVTLDDASWFINLYKVRDILCKIYNGEKNVKVKLGIRSGDWTDFGTVLNNNDLRHAEISGAAPSISPAKVRQVYALARTWVESYLRTKCMPVAIPPTL
jgi:hypothetical protein